MNARQRDDVTILDLKGKITIGAGDLALRDAIHEALDGGAKKILINTAGRHDHRLLGRRRAGERLHHGHQPGRQVKLVQPAAKVNDILTITQLITVFDVYDTEDEAVAPSDRS